MKDLVVKTNKLISAVQHLGLVEIRLIQLAIIDARETGMGLSPDKPLTIDAKRYAEAFGVHKSNAYKIIKQAEETLFNRRFSFVDDDGKLVKSRWVQQVKYFDDEGKIELFGTKAGAKLDPELTIYNEMNGYMTNVTLSRSTALSFDGLFANEINHFVECVKTGAPCRNPAEDGVTLMKILDGIYESARTGHEVVIN